MIDVVNMCLDELYELADTLDDVRYLTKKYDPEWLDADALKAEARAVDEQIDKIEAANRAAMNREYEKEALL
nr:MAG TPA: hypothetical protein [Caudoviricetes sp.]